MDRKICLDSDIIINLSRDENRIEDLLPYNIKHFERLKKFGLKLVL